MQVPKPMMYEKEYRDLINELEHHWFMYQNCVENIKKVLKELKKEKK